MTVSDMQSEEPWLCGSLVAVSMTGHFIGAVLGLENTSRAETHKIYSLDI
jgi:hypothetical protein